MQHYKKKVLETTDFLRKQTPMLPEIAFLTGTGLGSSTASMEITTTIPYSRIPNFPVSTVESHKGELIFGILGGKPLMVMQGRFHLYEGYSPLEVTFPIRVMQELGVKTLIISNASGGINLNFSAGDIMVITDHINLTGCNPLTGHNEESWGIRFPDMTEVYNRELASLALKSAADLTSHVSLQQDLSVPTQQGISVPTQQGISVPLRQGVYAGLQGPSLETPAETRYLKSIGADAVGFSTIMEAIAGVHAGMKILGLAIITNINNPDVPEKATVEEIIETAQQTVGDLNRLLQKLLEQL